MLFVRKTGRFFFPNYMRKLSQMIVFPILFCRFFGRFSPSSASVAHCRSLVGERHSGAGGIAAMYVSRSISSTAPLARSCGSNSAATL